MLVKSAKTNTIFIYAKQPPLKGKLPVYLHYWLVGCLGLNGPLRQYYSLYRAGSQREGERKEK